MINILHYASMRCVDPATNKNKEYHAQVIATSGGYACVIQHGRIGSRLQDRLRTLDPVPYEMAKATFERICVDQMDEYEREAPMVPNVPRYADGDYYVVPANELAEFREEHEATFGSAAANEERSKAIKSAREEKTRKAAAALATIILDRKTRIDTTPEANVVIEKSGSTIACIGVDDERGRKVAKEIGGSFKAKGLFIGDCFYVVDITSTTASRAELLKFVRRHIVSDELPNGERTHGEVIAAVRDVLNRHSSMPVRLVAPDGTRMSINPIDVLTYGDHFPAELQTLLMEPAVS